MKKSTSTHRRSNLLNPIKDISTYVLHGFTLGVHSTIDRRIQFREASYAARRLAGMQPAWFFFCVLAERISCNEDLSERKTWKPEMLTFTPDNLKFQIRNPIKWMLPTKEEVKLVKSRAPRFNFSVLRKLYDENDRVLSAAKIGSLLHLGYMGTAASMAQRIVMAAMAERLSCEFNSRRWAFRDPRNVFVKFNDVLELIQTDGLLADPQWTAREKRLIDLRSGSKRNWNKPWVALKTHFAESYLPEVMRQDARGNPALVPA